MQILAERKFPTDSICLKLYLDVARWDAVQNTSQMDMEGGGGCSCGSETPTLNKGKLLVKSRPLIRDTNHYLVLFPYTVLRCISYLQMCFKITY